MCLPSGKSTQKLAGVLQMTATLPGSVRHRVAEMPRHQRRHAAQMYGCYHVRIYAT